MGYAWCLQELPVKSAPFVLAALLCPCTAQGQELVESMIEYSVGTADGKTKLCGVDAKISFMDSTYRKGALSVIIASLSWAESRGKLGIFLKVTGLDFDALMQPHPFKVNNAFLAVKGLPVPLSGSFQCENALNFCGGYLPPLAPIIYENIDKGDLSIGFNRQSGGLDIVLPISSSSENAFDPTKYVAFHMCVEEMSKRLSAKAAKD
jgi:hypothetical protein